MLNADERNRSICYPPLGVSISCESFRTNSTSTQRQTNQSSQCKDVATLCCEPLLAPVAVWPEYESVHLSRTIPLVAQRRGTVSCGGVVSFGSGHHIYIYIYFVPYPTKWFRSRASSRPFETRYCPIDYFVFFSSFVSLCFAFLRIVLEINARR